MLVLLCPAGRTGVVVDMEVKVSDSGGHVDSETFYAEGERVRIDPHTASGADEMSAIFKDQTLWLVNHDEKLCRTIDWALRN